MSASMRMGLHGYLSVLGIFVLACGDNATAPAARNATAIRGSSVPASFAVAKVAASSLTGRIVWTNGTLQIYNLATSTNASLGISGVNPKFSPAGTRITYQGKSGISVMNSDGTNKRVLSASGGAPSFDSTGTMIAFDNNGIWKINVDGTGLTRLTTTGRQPAWSPDGTQIVYHAPVGGIAQLFIMNADGTNPHQALTSGSVLDVVWQPSSKILFGISSGNYDLYSFDPASPSSLTRLTTSTTSDVEASWSPDGTQISWTSGTSGKTSGIWVMNADGTSKQGPVIPKGRQGSWGK